MKIIYCDPEQLKIITDKKIKNGDAVSFENLIPSPTLPAILCKKLSQAINTLPKKQSKIIKLVRKGLSDAEISVKLKMPISSVRYNRNKAIELLKSKLVFSKTEASN